MAEYEAQVFPVVEAKNKVYQRKPLLISKINLVQLLAS